MIENLKRIEKDYKRLGRIKKNPVDTDDVAGFTKENQSQRKSKVNLNRNSQRAEIQFNSNPIKRRIRVESEKSRNDLNRVTKGGKNRKTKVVNKGKRERERKVKRENSNPANHALNHDKKTNLYTRVGVNVVNDALKDSIQSKQRRRKGRSFFDSHSVDQGYKWLILEVNGNDGNKRKRTKQDRSRMRELSRDQKENEDMTREKRSTHNRGKSRFFRNTTRSNSGRRRKGIRFRIRRRRKQISEKKQNESMMK